MYASARISTVLPRPHCSHPGRPWREPGARNFGDAATSGYESAQQATDQSAEVAAMEADQAADATAETIENSAEDAAGMIKEGNY